MVIGNRKKVLYKILPYEYRTLEIYLEEMALKGWKFEDVQGEFLSFVKIEPTRIRYWVDINGTNPLITVKEALTDSWGNKREEWKLVYRFNEVDIYFREDGVEEFSNKIDEEEKFKSIAKLSLKKIFMTLLTVGLLFFPTLMNDFNLVIVSDVGVVLWIITAIVIIYQITNLTGFLRWYINGKVSIRKDEPVSYEAHWFSKVINIINTIILLTGSAFIVILAMFSKDVEINSTFGLAILMVVIIIIIDIISKNSEKALTKKKIDIFNIVGLVVLIAVFSTRVYISKDIEFNNYNPNKEFNLSLEDFDDKSNNTENYYYSESNGTMASSLWFHDRGEKGYLDYNLFESKYKWIVDKYLEEKLEWISTLGDYPLEKLEYAEGVTLYNIKEISSYMLVSEEKVINFIRLDYSYDIDEFIKKVYEEVFREI